MAYLIFIKHEKACFISLKIIENTRKFGLFTSTQTALILPWFWDLVNFELKKYNFDLVKFKQ